MGIPNPLALHIKGKDMNPLDVVKLSELMRYTEGRPDVKIGLIDGPVALNYFRPTNKNIREIPGKLAGTCSLASSVACMHGTFVAGILCGERGSVTPAICPSCTLLLRPIFSETDSGNGGMPSATPEELAEAIIDCINAGARVINLSAALAQPSSKGEHKLEESLDYAARRGAIVVAAAGNQGTVGSSAITRHPWGIPVVACDLRGRPVSYSNLGISIGKRGLCAPGDGITSLGADGKPLTLGGTSVAAPFVTGAIALLMSEFPDAGGAVVKLALTHAKRQRRTSVAPPLLDAWEAYQALKTGLIR